jgi:archaellum component FlaD/FlaE
MDIFEQLFGGGGQSMSDAEPEEPAVDAESTEPSSESEPDDDERALRDLDVRVGDLESSLEQTESSLKAIRSQQSELSEDIEEVNDTVRQLLGVYDQLTAESNPFEDGHDSGFGVVEAPDNDSEDGEALDATSDDSHDAEDEEVVTFEDLTDENGESESNVAPVEDEEFLWDEAEASEDHHDEKRGSDEQEALTDETTDAQLTEIEGGYAADLLVFEWLSELVCASGPASTLKALDYYESVGWISPSVRRELEAVLSGPHLDAHVDPGEPSELSAGNHADSHGYVRRLGALAAIDI